MNSYSPFVDYLDYAGALFNKNDAEENVKTRQVEKPEPRNSSSIMTSIRLRTTSESSKETDFSDDIPSQRETWFRVSSPEVPERGRPLLPQSQVSFNCVDSNSSSADSARSLRVKASTYIKELGLPEDSLNFDRVEFTSSATDLRPDSSSADSAYMLGDRTSTYVKDRGIPGDSRCMHMVQGNFDRVERVSSVTDLRSESSSTDSVRRLRVKASTHTKDHGLPEDTRCFTQDNFDRVELVSSATDLRGSCHLDATSSNCSSATVSGLMEQFVLDVFERKFRSERNSRPTVCVLCQRNGETVEYYSTHVLKDNRGKVICPVLRKLVCPVCQATGDNAHTLRHCPQRKNQFSMAEAFKTARTSNGIRKF